MRCTPARRATSLIWVAAGPTVRCSSIVASVIRRRVSASRSARFFSSYLRFSVISLDTMLLELTFMAPQGHDGWTGRPSKEGSAMTAQLGRRLGPEEGVIVRLPGL